MLVRDIMNTDVVTATAETAIGQVAKLMADQDVGSVVILEGGKPVGIVTDRDLVVDHLAKVRLDRFAGVEVGPRRAGDLVCLALGEHPATERLADRLLCRGCCRVTLLVHQD